MIRYFFTVSCVVLCVFLFSSARATSDFQVKPASSCPALFGSAVSRAANFQARKQYLESVEQGQYLVNLTYSGQWTEPSVVRFKGISLAATIGIDGDRPSALLDVGEIPQGVACDPGLFEIQVDDSLGADGHVLAIVKDAVLFERGGQLFFLIVSRAQEPIFRMIWRSTWTISGQQQSSAAYAKPASNRNYHRPKPVKRSSPKHAGMKTTIRR